MKNLPKAIRVIAIALTAVLTGGVLATLPLPASAVNGADFDPGFIISDEAFFNHGSMGEAEIQAFLQSQVPRCAGSNGQPCLKDYYVDTFSRGAAGTSHCGAYQGAPRESAARIIQKVAAACRINPQVLIVNLQKEQGLVTAVSPTERQYRVAMGFGCPDTAPCDAQFYGFYNQVYKAAWQFRQYTNFPDRRYKVGQVSVQYHPNAACGASMVNIRNQATANLYNYTPYQPNAASLARMYGVGDSCSSYGNRNFWAYFNDWFDDSGWEGRIAIQRAWDAHGGAGGQLGQPVSGVLSVAANGGGLGQAFEGGSIYWTGRTGARVVTGNVLRYYHAVGGETGYLAWPNSDLLNYAANGGGVGQSFQGGSIYSSAAGGTRAVSGSILAVYHRLGGESGELGWPNSEVLNVAANGGGRAQSFSTGSIYANSRGTFPVTGAIRTAYHQLQGERGSLGWPVTDRIAVAANGGGTGQAFQGGSIYHSAAGAFAVTGPVRAEYHARQGETGRLGWPTASQTCSTDTGCSQTFQGGTIYWSKATGTRVGLPEIDAVHQASGGDGGALGRVTSELLYIDANGGGVGQAFERGSVYWTRTHGAFAVSGPIRNFYFGQRGEQGTLGWPTAAQACAPDGSCSQAFQGGAIYWTPASGARVGHPAIEAEHARLGGVSGALGRPVSGLLHVAANGGGVGQAFERGSIYWSASRGAFAVTGQIRSVYHRLSGESGILGWPDSPPLEVTVNGGGSGQSFQGGSIYSSRYGTFEVVGAIRSAYHGSGGETGPLGWPTTGRLAVAANGGGIGQAFERGSIYHSVGRGAFLVSGGLRDFYFSLGGETGRLGWPTSAQVCSTAGACTQTFQGGTAQWSPASGGSIR